MKKRLIPLASAWALLIPAAVVTSAPASAQVIIAPFAPPPMRVEPVPPPRSGYVWDNGHWHWQGRGYVWAPGHWRAIWLADAHATRSIPVKTFLNRCRPLNLI